MSASPPISLGIDISKATFDAALLKVQNDVHFGLMATFDDPRGIARRR